MKRPKQNDLPDMNGPGVAPVKDKVLDKLGDEYISMRDDRAKLVEDIGTCEKKILERMTEKEMTRYQFSDQVIIVKPGHTRIKIKSVTATDGDTGGDPENEAA